MESKKEEYLGTYFPEYLTRNDRQIGDVNEATPSGKSCQWVIKNIRISANNNVVMDVGENAMIVLEGTSEMVNIPHGQRFANAAFRIQKSIGRTCYQNDGTPWGFGVILGRLNTRIMNGKVLTLIVEHDSEKGRGFGLTFGDDFDADELEITEEE